MKKFNHEEIKNLFSEMYTFWSHNFDTDITSDKVKVYLDVYKDFPIFDKRAFSKIQKFFNVPTQNIEIRYELYDDVYEKELETKYRLCVVIKL